MTDEKLTPRLVLSVFQKIIDSGSKQGDEYHFNGLYAFSDHDGYTLFIRDQHVTLSLYFHNKMHLDFRKRIHRDEFVDAVLRVARLAQ